MVNAAWYEREINYLDLFSGIGGFHLGLKNAGFRFKWAGYSEIDAAAKNIYRRHFPESEDLGDVTKIKERDLPEVDVITFGFPCQDLSVAGKRKGLHAARSGLFFEAMRIVRAARPTVFIFENVQGLLHSNRGEDFKTVLGTVADVGLYECEGQLLNTRWVLPQNRERFYLVGHLRGASRPKVFPFGKGAAAGDPQKGCDPGIEVIGAKRGKRNMIGQRIFTANKASTALTTAEQDCILEPRFTIDRRTMKLRRHRLQNRPVRLSSIKCRARYLTPIERERLQGFPDEWTAFGRDDLGLLTRISDSQRLKVLGNAVSVPIVQAIGERLRRD